MLPCYNEASLYMLLQMGYIHARMHQWLFRCITYLRCATENSADVVVGVFSGAILEFGLPSRVRSDHGYENASVALVMNLIRGLQHHAHITGRSVHNQRIERLWRDVHKEVTEVIYRELYRLEDEGVLNPDTPLHP